MIRAIVFDMDGLLVDTERLYWAVARTIAAEYGKSVSDQTLRLTMGRDRLSASRVLVDQIGLPIDAQTLMERRESMMLERLRAGDIAPMPGSREILQRFKNRLKLGISTSAPRKLAEVTLPAIGFEGIFEAITTGDEVTRGKPHPEIYLSTMRKLAVAPNDCIVLEDAPAGALAGKRSGAYTIAVPSDLTAGEDFSQLANDRAVNLFDAAERIEALLRPSSI